VQSNQTNEEGFGNAVAFGSTLILLECNWCIHLKRLKHHSLGFITIAPRPIGDPPLQRDKPPLQML
jgi:hypothetical protein